MNDGVMTKEDVIANLKAKGFEVSVITWGAIIDPSAVSWTALDEKGRQVVSGTLALRLRLDGDRILADADVTVLGPGEVPF